MTETQTPRILGSFALWWSRSGRARPPAGLTGEIVAAARRFDLPGGGCLVAAFAGQDVALDPSTLVAKIGVLRRPGGGRLSAREILEQRTATPETIEASRLTGNGLVLAVDLAAPRLAAFATILAMPQLYHAATADGFVVASEVRLVLPFLDRVELDETALPSHFLFRFVPGERTYLRGVIRLASGVLLRLDGDSVERRRLRTLRDVVAGLPRFERIDDAGLEWLDRRMATTTERWVEEVEARGLKPGNLLSGGLDSTLVQAWLNELGPRVDRRTWSFSVDTPSFEFEEHYAREASALLATEHHFARVSRQRYLELFDRAIDTVAAPTLYTEAWPCWLEVGGQIAAMPGMATAMLAGNGADALHGVSDLRAITYWRQLAVRPRLRQRLLAVLPELRARPSAEPWVDALEMNGDPASLRDPTSFVSIAGELDIAIPAFGERALFDAFEERRQMELEFYGSEHFFERVMVLDLVSTGIDPTLSMMQLVGSQGVDALQVYMDEEAMAAPFAFSPDIRFLRGRVPWAYRPKPLQQALLQRRGLGAVVGRKKGGTNFTEDLWKWYTEGVLRERVEAIERPAWLSTEALAELKRRPTYILWNLVVFDAFRRRIVEPASRAVAAD